MKTITVSQQAIGGLFQKNPNKGGWGYTFLKKDPGIFRFVTLSLEIRKKTSFHRWKFCKLCGRYPFWKFQRQKPRPREIPLSVFLEQPWKFHFFFNWLLELPHALSSIPHGNSMFSSSPVLPSFTPPRRPAVWIYFWQ